ncbi:MAG: hypothetical protein N5P05_000044 [Chroococcopsis gigantea SAG 12.99]|nr:Uma2 family endonuclease [Chlorogloea purpurea SAG 13.99]MDV2998438.1 hypothetical protein [Chroococcopsis gigantea SAG 12.99]
MRSIAINDTSLLIDPGSEVILSFQSWSDYEQLLGLRDEGVLPKIYFNADSGKIRLMSPLPSHGNRVDTLKSLIKILLHHYNKDFQSFDPITLTKISRAGVEPDGCFYVDNYSAILGKDKIDLTIDPPPDLALEVDITSRTNPDDYSSIAVPELWIYRPPQLLIYVLSGEQYDEKERSTLFSEIDIKNILPTYIERAWLQGSSLALREFELFLIP